MDASMSRTTKILGFSVPPAVVKEVETLAKEERRTKSELFREMVRVYRRYREQRDRDEDRWIMNLIQQAQAEQAKNPMSTEEMLKESERLARYGEIQAKKLGIKPKDVNRLIHEYRQSRRS
jgi:metal-responsive CopG/Arc/MetJ family transcriptional regulator